MSCKVPGGDIRQALLYIAELIQRKLRQQWHRLKDQRREGHRGVPTVRRAVLCFLHVRCSANRSGDPIVAGKRPNSYAINYPELQARIEMAHRPLIEVNDAARR
jgi:hypothetical protein